MMDKSAADFRSLTADLENTKYTDVVKDTSVEKGHIYVRKDSKMRIEITEPDPRTILRVGDSLSVYTPKIKRVVFACFDDAMFARYAAELKRRQAPPSKPV